jgi:hypothetical protein
MIRKYRAWADSRKQQREIERVILDLYQMEFQKMAAPHEKFILRKMNDDLLHKWIADAPAGKAKVALERELRRREKQPAIYISLAALLVSILALLVALIKDD